MIEEVHRGVGAFRVSSHFLFSLPLLPLCGRKRDQTVSYSCCRASPTTMELQANINVFLKLILFIEFDHRNRKITKSGPH